MKNSVSEGRSETPVSQAHWLTSGRERTAVALLLLTALALAAGSAAQKSVTVDEYQALPHGLAIWKTGDLHLATGVPLLPSIVPAAPLLATQARLDVVAMPEYTRSWQCGLQFLIDNAFERDPRSGQFLPTGRYHDYFLLGRSMSIVVLLLTCALVYGFARRLYGREAALLALAVACFSPNLLAHGRLVTPDIYLTAATIGSLWALDRLLDAPSLLRAAVLGLALGFAALSKLTGLSLFVLFPSCAVLLPICRERPLWLSGALEAISFPRSRNDTEGVPYRRSLWPRLLFALALGLLVVNAAYRFEGSFSPLAGFNFESTQIKRVAAVLPPWLPVPLPRYFFQGIDEQLAESGYTAYLMGEFNDTGFYSYYLIALLVKTPLPALLLCGLAWLFGGWPTRREMPLILVAFALLLFFSVSRHKNIGVRYVLFLEPMMAAWIGRLLADGAYPKRWLRGAVIAATACLAAIALASWPHYLPYFNWASGGPKNGHRWLLDSNLDWGQDLIALRRYMEKEGITEIDLACFGRVPPEAYGIRYRTLPAGEAPRNRHVAISANLLWGLMYIVNGDLNYWPADSDGYRAFRHRRPAAILGHSIYVFDLE
jgi:4-amino-4-deoxy-L-arabinose transferase-like glycosyltransferase